MARPKYPSDEIDKTMVRFPPGLMGRLKSAATGNHRSMNAEIIARLEASFSGEPQVLSAAHAEQIAKDAADKALDYLLQAIAGTPPHQAISAGVLQGLLAQNQKGAKKPK